MLPEELREEITPKNIIMKGPTGVGKTEIARRLAKLVKAPFVKVEATKFTEVGYVGRDVESIVRDLVEAAVRLVREEKYKEVQPKVQDTVETKLVNLILPLRKQAGRDEPDIALKEEILQELRKGNLDKLQISVEAVDEPKNMQIDVGQGQEINIGSIFGNFMPKKKKTRTVTVKQARDIFTAEESAKLVDNDSIATEALRRAEQDGVILSMKSIRLRRAAIRRGPTCRGKAYSATFCPSSKGARYRRNTASFAPTLFCSSRRARSISARCRI